MDLLGVLLGFVCTWSLVSGQSLTYGLKGHEVSLSPGVSEKLDQILWRHKGNKVVEFYGYSQQEYGQFVKRVTLNLVSAELQISDLTYEDSGEYELELFTYANNRLSRHYFDLQVIDKVAKPNISCEMSSDLTNEKEATLNCSAESRQPQPLKYEWISDGAVQSGQTLKITLSSEHDDEEYTCRVSNPLTDATAKFTAKDCYPDEVSVALIAGLSVGIIILICLFIATIIFIRRLKQKPKDLHNERRKSTEEEGLLPKQRTQQAIGLPAANNNIAPNDPDTNKTNYQRSAIEIEIETLQQKVSVEACARLFEKQNQGQEPEPETKPPPVMETKETTDEHKSDKTGEENIENDQLSVKEDGQQKLGTEEQACTGSQQKGAETIEHEQDLKRQQDETHEGENNNEMTSWSDENTSDVSSVTSESTVGSDKSTENSDEDETPVHHRTMHRHRQLFTHSFTPRDNFRVPS